MTHPYIIITLGMTYLCYVAVISQSLTEDSPVGTISGSGPFLLPCLFLLQDVGQSILESYSRVMECLAFNVMARIDDVLYVDDSTKQCVAAESMSLRSWGGLGGLPIQKRMSPSPFSIQHTPYSSPYATPTLCSSPPGVQSPGKATQYSEKNGLKGHHCQKFEIPKPADLDKLWSYAGNLGSRRAYGDAPERD